MISNLAQKLQELKQLVENSLLTSAEYERERETLLAAWRAPSAPSAPAVSIDLNALPTVIALPLREYLDETHPVLKLWYACDGVEMLLRLVVMMGLAVLSQRGPLTPKLRKRLQEYRLEEPTLGNWRALADAVMEALGDAPGPLPELPGLVRATLAPLLLGFNESERDESNSFIRLRNRLAHGGGISRALAQRLGEIWQPRLLALWEQLAWLAQVELVVQDGQGGYGVLRGPNPQAKPYSPRDPAALAQAFAAGDAVLLARDEVLLPLWPLALYGPPRSPNPDAPPADEIVPQVYLRRGEVCLQYTPLGAMAAGLSESEEHALERFLDWFKVADEPRARHGRFQIRDFTDEMRKDGLRLIGREQECETLKNAVAERTEGVVWVSGVAGIGKSYLFAWLVLHLLDEPPPATLVLPYRFRAGDERCSREAFLRFAVERLAAWLEVEVEADSTPWFKRLQKLLEQLTERRVMFLLDGLDEITARDARFAQEAPLVLTGLGILWVCAGRPEYDLPAVFAAAGAFQPFPDGLPKMDAGDIRTLLLERIGPLRKHLLRHDQEQGERIGNPFVEKVAQAAAGVPLYVKYVIDDIFAGRYRVLDGHERLPPSLSAYYEELLRRLSVGDLHQVLTPLAATLAVVLEPLDAPALAALLYRRGKLVPEGEVGLRLVERGLSAIASMLKRAPTLAGRDGYTLYHLSLRQHMAASEHSQAAVATAREVLGDLALDVASDAAAPYLYRCGIAHLLETHRAEKTLGLLTRFEYVMGRLRTLTAPEAVGGLGEDWRATVQHVGLLDREQRLWEAFWREREHILRRGDDRWPAYKILLQLAVEHADDSPVTRQAEAWLEAGHCDWVWLRNPQRIKHAAPNPCLRVFEGHTQGVDGALELEGGRILSWSQDGTLRLWSQASGIELAKLNVDTSAICVNVLANGRILFLSRLISTLMLLDESNLTILSQNQLTGFKVINYGSSLFIYALTDEKQMFFWEGNILFEYVEAKGFVTLVGNVDVKKSNLMIKALGALMEYKWSSCNGWLDQYRNPSDRVWKSPIPLTSGRVLFWTMEGELRLLLPHHDISVAFEGMIDLIIGAEELMDGRILSWSKDGTLRIWKVPSIDDIYSQLAIRFLQEINNKEVNNNVYLPECTELAVLSGHTAKIVDVNILINGRILSWSEDGTLRLWDGTDGSELAVLSGHDGSIMGAKILPDGRILSWSEDGTLRLWDGTDGSELAVLSGHDGSITGVEVLADGRILSWSKDGTLRLWDGIDGSELALLRQDADSFMHNIIGAKILKDGCILSWSGYDPRLRLWDTAGSYSYSEYNEERLSLSEVILEDGRILSLGPDKTLRLWNVITGSIQVVMTGFSSRYLKAIELSNRRVLFWALSKNNNLSWQNDNTLRVINSEGKIEREIITGHIGNITTIDLSNERVLSWGCDDNALQVWNVANGTKVAVMSHHERIMWTRVLSSGCIISCWENLDDSQYVNLRVWDQTNASKLMVKAGYNEIYELKNGCFLLYNQNDNMLKICDETNGKELKILPIPVEIQGIKLLADGRILAWGKGSGDNKLRVWDVTNGTEIAVMFIEKEYFCGAGILEDERIVTIATNYTNFYIENEVQKTSVILQSWDMKGKELATLKFTLLGQISLSGNVVKPGQIYLSDSITMIRGKILMKLEKIGYFDITDMFLLWDGTENHDALEVLQKKDLPWAAPQLLSKSLFIQSNGLFPISHISSLTDSNFIGWSNYDQNICGIAKRDKPSLEIPVWHSDTSSSPEVLLPDGTLVIKCGNHVFCLKLHHGARRITLAEWEAMLAKTDRASCETQSNATPAS